MKKLTVLLAGLFLLTASVPALAADDRPITVAELPAAAQQFIKTHFADTKVSYAQVDGMIDKEYTVIFVDGSKVEFTRNGEWDDVKCKHAEVPAAIIPQQIRYFVAQNHPGQKITSIERSRNGYDLELSNGLDLDFNKQFQLVKMDD